jgi:PAS domain S-box-containing protein
MYDDISKVIYIGNDETKERLMELETRKQTDLLKKQEEELRMSRLDLRSQLKQSKDEVRQQFKEIEKVKIRNERTLEGALDAIITIDNHGIIKFYNKAAEELWGVGKDTVLGRSINKLFPENDYADEFINSFIDPNAEKIIGQRREVTIKDINGEEKSVIFLLSQARLEDETTYTAFIQNISVDLF